MRYRREAVRGRGEADFRGTTKKTLPESGASRSAKTSRFHSQIMPSPNGFFYDSPGAFYDAGLVYDGDINPTQNTKKHKMASFNLGLSRKNPTQLVALGELVVPKLAPAAPATPPVPNMATKVATLATKTAAAKAANDEYEAAKAELVVLKQLRDATADDLRDEHNSVAKAVESEAKGDAVMLAASGYPLAADSTASTQPPGQVKNLALTAGDNPGTLDATFDPEDFAKAYELQITTVDPVAGPWVTHCSQTASRCEITGQTSGQRVWARARAIGSNGPGPWSDPATKIVP